MKTVYRIIAPIISIAIFPVLYFFPMFRIMITSGLSAGETKTNLLTSFTGLKEFTSFSDIVDMVRNKSDQLNIFKSILDNIKDETKEKFFGDSKCIEWLIAAGVFFCLFMLLVLAFTVVSAVMKKHVPSLIISVCAFVSLVATNGCFNNFAKPFLDGSIGISSLLNSGTNVNIGAIVGKLLSVDCLQLGIAYNFALFMVIVIGIGTICVLFEEYYAKN